MLNIIIFSLLSSIFVTLILYMESNLSEEDKDITEFLKNFVITFIVNFISMFIFENVASSNMYSLPVEVGLMD